METFTQRLGVSQPGIDKKIKSRFSLTSPWQPLVANPARV